MGWLDSHCHLPGDDRGGEVVAEAAAAGVTTMVTVGCDRASSLEALDVAGRVRPASTPPSALHPHDAERTASTRSRDLFDGPQRPVAVGECGLDYHYDHSPRDVQREAFAAQIALAHELGLPLVIHTREAWDDTFDILDAEGVPARTVFHCFTGGRRRGAPLPRPRGVPQLLRHRHVQGRTRRPRGGRARAPLDRMLVETDSPFLAPVPNRGKPNRPAWVPFVGACLADVHGVDVEAIRDVASRRRAALELGVRSDPRPDGSSDRQFAFWPAGT